MSSRPSFARIALPLVVAAAGAGLIGCGHKAPPTPPALKNPAATIDLKVQQRGLAAILTFTYPQTTVAGELLEKIELVELWSVKRPVSPPAQPEDDLEAAPEAMPDDAMPQTDAPVDFEATDESPDGEGPREEAQDLLPEIRLEDQTAAEPLEFGATAQLMETLNEDAIELGSDGTQLVFQVNLGEASHEQWSYTFAIKTFASEKLPSAYSNLVTLVQRQPPAEPTEFQAAAEASGIRLSWSLSETEEDSPEAIRIYRRSSESRNYGEPLARLESDAREYLDSSAVFGERYIYAVTAVGHEDPLVESFFGGEREIDFADRFAPKPPTNLIALAEAGRVRLLWDASADQDVVGYIVFRRQAGSEFRRLTEEPVIGVEYNDRTVAVGTTYDYRIAAVDRVGNQGEQSESVLARVP